MSRETVCRLIDARQVELLRLRRRIDWWTDIQAALAAMTKGKRFWVHDSFAWLCLLDMRDICIIDLASFVKHMYEPGGLLDELAKNGAQFPKVAVDRGPDDIPHYRRIFDGLFPDCTAAKATPSDFRQLRETLKGTMDTLAADRNQNRAHRFERDTRQKVAGDVGMLDHKDVMAAFEIVSEMLNQLRSIACNSWLAMNNLDPADPKSVQLLLDLVVLSSPAEDDEQRARLLEALHEQWDPSGEELFNEYPRIWSLRNPELAALVPD